MRKYFERLIRDEGAATAVEYAVISALIGVALIGTLTAFSDEIKQMLESAGDAISEASG